MNIYSLLLLIVGCSITSGVIGSNISELKTDKNEEEKSLGDAITATSTHSNTDPEADVHHKHITNAVNTGPNPETSSDETGNEEGENGNDDKNKISAYTNPTAEDAQIPGNQKPIKITQDIDIERVTGSPGSKSTVDENKNGKSLNNANDETSAHTDADGVQTDGNAPTPGNNTHISLTQTIEIGRITENTSEEHKNLQNGEVKNEKALEDAITGTTSHTYTYPEEQTNHTHITNAVNTGPNPESSSGETENDEQENTNDSKNDTLTNPTLGNHKPITVTQDIDIESITGSTGSDSTVDDNKNGKSPYGADDATTAYTPADHMLLTNTLADDTEYILESTRDEHENDEYVKEKNVNDDKNEISGQTNTADEVAQNPENDKKRTKPQDLGIERIADSASGEPENDEHDEGKNINDDKHEASKHIDSNDGVALPPPNHHGNHTHITITQAIEIGRNADSTNGEPENDENKKGKNVNHDNHETSAHIGADARTPENQKPIIITQDIDVDRTTERTGSEPTVDENSPNDTADAGVSLPAGHSANHTHITITQAIEIGGNAESPVAKSGNNENEEGKYGNDDKHETAGHTGEDGQTPDNQEHITITQDIDIERITESASSESAVGGNANENSSTVADIHHPANHTHITITQAIDTGRFGESIVGKPGNDENGERRNGNDDKHETSAHHDADSQTPGERKHITITQDVDIERTTESTDDDENDADDETSEHTNTNDVNAHHTANHTHITITQVIDIERITGNTSDGSDDDGNKEITPNDDNSGKSKNTDNSIPGEQSSAKQNHIIITQVIDIDRIAENNDSDESVADENEEESTSNEEKNRTSANINTIDAHSHTPANHTHVTITQEVDIGRTAAEIDAESGSVGTKTETIPIIGESSADEGSEPTPTDVQSIKMADTVPAIITQRPNETGSDESETIPNNAETNKDVKCKPCHTNTELRLRNCSSCHCGMLWHLIECNQGFKEYIQRILDNINKLSKRANCKCNKIEYKT